MEAERQAPDLKPFSSDLTNLADPHWQAHRQGHSGAAADPYSGSDYPRKRQALAHGSDERSTPANVIHQAQASLQHGQTVELQCCSQPAAPQREIEQLSHEQHSSLQSSSTAAQACKPSAMPQHASSEGSHKAHREQSHARASASDMQRLHLEEPPADQPLAPAQHEGTLQIVMEDDGGYVIPVVMTDRDIRMPSSPGAKRGRHRPEPEARPRRSRAAAIACQATIAEMVRDEEEDAMRAAAVSGKDAPRSDTMYDSFTSEEDDEAPSRSKGRRRRKGEPPRSRMGAPRRASRPGSTTASPVKVQIQEPWSLERDTAGTPGMSMVGPLHGPKNRLTPSAAPCPAAAWALQGYSGPMQEVGVGQLASWLRETARSGGLISAPFCFGLEDAAARDWQSAAVEKRYRSCFARMRQVTHDSPPELLEDTGQSRRSMRVRTQPDVFLPSYSSGAEELATSQPVKALTAEDTDMLLGEDYQAVLPQQQERPSQPTPAEQHWLQHKVLKVGELGTGTVVPDRIVHPSGCVQWRFGDKVLSSEKARELGLPGGTSQWLEADINCFAACLSRCGKDFGHIAQQLQPPKTRGEVVSFYYDMWKTRKIPRAQQWYNAAKEVPEEDFADKAALDAAARHRASVVKAEQRRQIKNALLWLHGTVRQPLEFNANRVKVLERLHRLRQVLHTKANCK